MHIIITVFIIVIIIIIIIIIITIFISWKVEVKFINCVTVTLHEQLSGQRKY